MTKKLTAAQSEYEAAVEKLRKFCEDHTDLTPIIIDAEYPIRVQFIPDSQLSLFGNENIDENGEVNDLTVAIGLSTAVRSTLKFKMDSKLLKKMIKLAENVGILYYHAFRASIGDRDTPKRPDYEGDGYDENGELVGGVAKFFASIKSEITEALGLTPNTLVAISADNKLLKAQKTAGALIKAFGYATENHIDREQYAFCWIVDFPMYEIGDESGELEFCHNPFSMPQGGMQAIKDAEGNVEKILDIKAYQYDIVCNGVELSSGAVRNHDPELMVAAFNIVGLGEDDVKAKFPAMYNAFCYGAPPHAGVAPGVDRMVMLLADVDTIREVIPFPMNKRAQDIMMGAPSFVEDKQLRDVHIKVVE